MNQINAPIQSWSFGRKLGFRLLFAFFTLYIFPFPLDSIPFINKISDWYFNSWDAIIPWMGKHILHLSYEITIRPNGSGDTTWNYVQLLLMVFLSVTTSIVWTVLDRKRSNYQKLSEWFMLFLRFYLVLVMFNYGFAKIFKTQFAFPNLAKLLQPLGLSSPMGLAWSYMGYSTPYNMFTGLMEVSGGIFLMFRRSATLGALITLTVMSNVAMMNFSYDIPVKLFSLVLVLMSVYIAMADIKRLVNVFILNKDAPAIKNFYFFSNPIKQKIFHCACALIVGYSSYTIITAKLEQRKQPWTDTGPKPSLSGIYDVKSFIRNGDTIPPLLTDASRWKRLVVDINENILYSMKDMYLPQKVELDTLKSVATISLYNDPEKKCELKYRAVNKDSLVFSGTLFKDSVFITFKKFDLSKYTLVNRGFHWINEYPFNR